MKKWVIKIGSAVLTNNGLGINTEKLNKWAEEIIWLQSLGVKIVIVSSGSIAEGMQRLGWKHRPKLMSELQSAAAVGQMGLIQAYENQFRLHGVNTAQILLTHSDLISRTRYLNAKNTIETLLSHKVIPIINENDTVVTDEIKFGDNDSLAGFTANLLRADLLVILTDQLGLYDKNPLQHNDATLIQEDYIENKALLRMASNEAGKFGSGGMYTKVLAAKTAARSGTNTIIVSGEEQNTFKKIYQGEEIGTLLKPSQSPLASRKNWMVNHLHAKGKVVLDDGAAEAITTKGKSLLGIGISTVSGNFDAGDLVECFNVKGIKIACGLINYKIDDCQKIINQPSIKIEAILGYITDEAIIHRDNLVLLT